MAEISITESDILITKSDKGTLMLKKLFSSRVRAKLLTALFISPGIEQNAWELTQSMGENYSAVWRELNRLEGIGILVSEPKGNSKAYRVNNSCPIEQELRSIVMKTEGIGGLLREKLGKLKKVKCSFIYGSYASGRADRFSDIDLMIIGEDSLEDISFLINEVERGLNLPINYVIYTEKEWKEKLTKKDAFVENVINSDRIMLVGDENAL